MSWFGGVVVVFGGCCCGDGEGEEVASVVAVARKRGFGDWNGVLVWGEGLWRAICCLVPWKRRWTGEAVVVVEVEAALQGVMRAGWSFTHISAERRWAGWEESMVGNGDWKTRLCFLVMILSREVSRRAVSGTRAGGMVIGEHQDGG